MRGAGDPRIDRWLAKDRPWRDEMRALRAILLDEGLTEALKWRLPCYALAGAGNVAILQPMKRECRLAFFKGAVLDDPDARLVSAGPNSRHGRHLAFRSLPEIGAAEDVIRSFVAQALAAEREGREVATFDDDMALPPELSDALADDGFREAWEALTPGRRRGWVLHVSGAKRSDTRVRRIDAARAAIAAGRGPHDR